MSNKANNKKYIKKIEINKNYKYQIQLIKS